MENVCVMYFKQQKSKTSSERIINVWKNQTQLCTGGKW